ncbi:hypothetical protein LTR09_003582 [Extremus antarcticus]|uniref:Uncharacterized protein n=1 Tax=Extremus antarcticus TaxID=702011 RepID=A0AAJ0DS97_9PEZI|nr:hypothetical protein LTR09_003582 [Extremus antarcticus]
MEPLPAGEANDDNDSLHDVARRSPSPLAFPETLEVHECRLLHDSSQYYNTHILPELVPAHLPFKRKDQLAHEWTTAPQILRNLMLVLVKGAQSRRNPSMPSSELYHYRACALNDLKCALGEAVEDQHGLVLSGIIVLMGIELLRPNLGDWAWLYHFNAARQIIQLRGGIGNCLSTLPQSESLLLKYMVVDIFRTTTCRASEMSEEDIDRQMKYIPINLQHRQAMVQSGHLWPQPLLEAIIDTNVLRLQEQKPLRKPCEAFVTNKSFDQVLSGIMTFDALRWSESVSTYGLDKPLRPGQEPDKTVRNAFNTLALAYKYAAQLYLMISVHAPTTIDDHEHITDLQSALSQQTDRLFSIASSNPNAAMDTQCWKFALWPAFISVLFKVCWCCRSVAEIEEEMKLVRVVAETLRNSSLPRTVDFVRTVADRRAAQPEAIWTWDDVFVARCAFVVC